MKSGWCLLSTLRPGAVFVTSEGVMALKTQYSGLTHAPDGKVTGTRPDCYLLASGEQAHFPLGGKTPVLEALVRSPLE